MTSVSDMPRIVQTILRGPWRHAAAALRACQGGAWPAFVRETAPAKPLLVGRLDHGRCIALAERPPSGPVLVELTIVPLWACSTDDGASTEWVAVHGVLEGGEALAILEPGPFIATADASPRADTLLECTVRRWSAATVVHTRSYAPEVPLALRAGAYGVLAMQIDDVRSVVERRSPAIERPTREVPMFASWYEPRVQVSPVLLEQIRALCITTPDDAASAP
jgi:hypothetical protein